MILSECRLVIESNIHIKCTCHKNSLELYHCELDTAQLSHTLFVVISRRRLSAEQRIERILLMPAHPSTVYGVLSLISTPSLMMKTISVYLHFNNKKRFRQMKRKNFLMNAKNNKKKNQFPLKYFSEIVDNFFFPLFKKRKKKKKLQKDEMITYAEMSLALETVLSMEKIDIPSTMTKGKHLKGEKFVLCKFIRCCCFFSCFVVIKEGQGRSLKRGFDDFEGNWSNDLWLSKVARKVAQNTVKRRPSAWNLVLTVWIKVQSTFNCQKSLEKLLTLLLTIQIILKSILWHKNSQQKRIAHDLSVSSSRCWTF